MNFLQNLKLKKSQTDEILKLCEPMWCAELPPSDGPADDHRLLVNELMRLMLRQQLFTFVTAAPVETPGGEVVPVAGTNNEAERTLRSPATFRKTGRTSKTLRGIRRQTILHSVLESIRRHLPEFTLGTVVAEITRWSQKGRSCFSELVESLGLKPRARPVLDAVLPA